MQRSLWRRLLYQKLATLTLRGTVLDLGGGRQSAYHALIAGEPTIEVANLDDGAEKEYTFDFEKPFPLTDRQFDGVLCINVLEHIFDCQHLVRESYRILAPGGTMVIGVPFLIRYHPSPNDYWRYTESTLERLLIDAGFREVNVTPIGTGPFGAAYSILHNVIHFSVLQWLSMKVAVLLDALVARVLPNSTFTTRNYPLGYVVIARK